MSFFGIFSICYLVFLLIHRLRHTWTWQQVFLRMSVLAGLQLWFMLADQFLWFLLAALVLAGFVRLVKHPAAPRWLVWPLGAMLIVNLIYTESGNGRYTFEDPNEFRAFHTELKSYYRATPFKLVEPSRRGPEGEIHVYETIRMIGSFGQPTQVKRDEQGHLYYYAPRGFGEMGHWFRFGIPPAEQVAFR